MACDDTVVFVNVYLTRKLGIAQKTARYCWYEVVLVGKAYDRQVLVHIVCKLLVAEPRLPEGRDTELRILGQEYLEGYGIKHAQCGAETMACNHNALGISTLR